MTTRYVLAREARPSDLDALAGFYDAYRVFYERTPDLAATRAFVADRLADGSTRFFIAEADDEPAGFMHLVPAYDTLGLRPAWNLEDLFVDPNFRKRGVASTLLAHAERFARETGATRVTLSTAHTNAAAQRVYVANGYVHDTVFRTYVRVVTPS